MSLRIVLKPMGAIATLGAMGLLAFLAVRQNTRSQVSVRDVATLPAKVMSAVPPSSAVGATSEAVYTDRLENGWEERGWAKVVDYANTTPAHAASTKSVRVEAARFEAVKIYHAAQDKSRYKFLTFYVHGGQVGGQELAVCFVASGKPTNSIDFMPLPPNRWVFVRIPIESLNVEGKRDLRAFWIQNVTFKDGADVPVTFYVDDIRLSVTNDSTEESLAVKPQSPAT